MKEYRKVYEGENIKAITVMTNDELTVIDIIDEEGIKTWCFHGKPFNFMIDEERERVKKLICDN